MINKAQAFAEKAHRGQFRKVAHIPYIEHPIRVANRLKKEAVSDELICAAYLHDVVEDTPDEIEDIDKAFGSRIATLVAAHTEDKSKTWHERKQNTIDVLKNNEKEVKYLIVADRLDNLLDFEEDYQTQGSSIWDHFNAGYEDQKWYNESIVNYMYDGLSKSDTPDFFTQFKETVERVFH